MMMMSISTGPYQTEKCRACCKHLSVPKSLILKAGKMSQRWSVTVLTKDSNYRVPFGVTDIESESEGMSFWDQKFKSCR